MQDTANMAAESEFDEEEEPSFSDAEDFVDDIEDEGKDAAMNDGSAASHQLLFTIYRLTLQC